MRHTIKGAALAALAVLSTLAPASAGTRQAVVRHNGASVMPFSQDATLHTFQPTADGGVMTINARTASALQVSRIRSHLEQERRAFARGDYSDPARIHGMAMPGLSELHAGAGLIRVSYSVLPRGAAIRFRTSDPKLIDAIHRWFAAQVSDHGHDAQMMH